MNLTQFILLCFSILSSCTSFNYKKRGPLSVKGANLPFVKLSDSELNAPDFTAKEEIVILTFGDFGTGEYKQFLVGEMMYKICKKHKCDFALLLGDNFYDEEYFYGKKDKRINSKVRNYKNRCRKEADNSISRSKRDDDFSEDGVLCSEDPKFRYMFELPYESLNTKIDNFTFWPVLGNHDYDDDILANVDAQVNYTKVSNRWKMPYRYYEIPKLPEWLTIYGLDTEMITDEDPNQDQAQLRDARNILCSKQGGPWKITFGHHPLLSYSLRGSFKGPYLNENKKDLDIMAESVYSMLNECKVDFYLSGHDHIQQHVVLNKDLHHIVQGAATSANPLISDLQRNSNDQWREAETYIHESYKNVDAQYVKGSTLGFSILKFKKNEAKVLFYQLVNERTESGYSFRIEKSYEKLIRR